MSLKRQLPWKIVNLLAGLMLRACFLAHMVHCVKDKIKYTWWRQNDWGLVKKAGSNKTNGKIYKNCKSSNFFQDKKTEVIDIIPPSKLQLMIGLFNIWLKHMVTDLKEDSLNWTQTCKLHGKQLMDLLLLQNILW